VSDEAQFLVIVALTLSILLISITLVIYETTTLIEVSPESDEWFITLNVEHDFPRALARALAVATNAVATNNSLDKNEAANIYASEELEAWRTAFLFAYAAEGIKANIISSSGLILALEHDREVNFTVLSEEGTVIDSTTIIRHIPNIIFDDYVILRWKFPEAISAISVSIHVDCESAGLYGWNYMYVVYLNVTVLNITVIERAQDALEYNITLIVTNERGPVEDLDLDNFQISEVPREKTSLFIFGGGKYIVSFSASLTTVNITVVDNRGIHVYVNDIPLEESS